MNYQHTVITTNDHLWELPQLIQFLIEHQGQDIVLNTNPEAHSLLESGLYDILDKFKFRSVTIHTWNVLEQHSKYIIKQKNPVLFFFDKKSWQDWEILEYQQKWNKLKKFGIFYGRPTADRLGIAGHMWTQHKKQTEFVVAFDPVPINDRLFYELTKLYDYHREGIRTFANLEPHLPMKPASVNYGNLLWKRNNPGMFDLYQNILIDIISEPNILGSAFFPTEKTIRAILMKKPFIIMGPVRSNAYLKQMGFQTFNRFWDENYDGYSGKNRYLRILQLIDNLANRLDLEQIYHDMQPILEHNYQILTQQLFNKKIKKI